MAAVDDQLAAITSSVSELKAAFVAKFADLKTRAESAEARAADAEKKLQDAAASAVPLDALKTFCDGLIADLKGVLE